MTMKAKHMMLMAVLAASLLAFGGESFARGGGGAGGGSGTGGGAGAGMGAGGGRGQGVQTMTQTRTQSMTQTQTQSQVRPEGSQRRDGSFMGTGTTANGAATRPGNGRGVMDGTGINHPQSPTP
jgi:hypothetical protein